MSPKILSSGVIIFRKEDKRLFFLLLYKGNNYWNFPRGKVEAKENIFKAALREVREETGLRAKDLSIIRGFKLFQNFSFRREGIMFHKTVILYLAKTKKKKIILSDEHLGYGWFTFGEAKKMLSRYKGNIALLVKVYNFLKANKRK